MILSSAEQLFSILDAPIHVFSKSERGVIGGKIPSPQALVRWVNAATRPEDFYVCLNPSVTNRIKPAIEDITHLRYWLLDFDPADTNNPVHADTLALVVAHALWYMFGYVPTMHRMDSGRGVQFWIPLTLTDGAAPDWQPSVAGATRALENELALSAGYQSCNLRLDTTCGEISHLARMPGTVNTKTGRLAEIGPRVGTRLLSFRDMLRFALTPIALPEPILPADAVPTALSVSTILAAVSPLNRAFLIGGTSAAAESRHNRLFACAMQLKELGVPEDFSRFLLTGAADACYPSLNLSDPGYVDRTLRGIYGSR